VRPERVFRDRESTHANVFSENVVGSSRSQFRRRREAVSRRSETTRPEVRRGSFRQETLRIFLRTARGNLIEVSDFVSVRGVLGLGLVLERANPKRFAAAGDFAGA
jgi:hypothetical protein